MSFLLCLNFLAIILATVLFFFQQKTANCFFSVITPGFFYCKAILSINLTPPIKAATNTLGSLLDFSFNG